MPRQVFMVRCASGVTMMRQRPVGTPIIDGTPAKPTPTARRSWPNTSPSESSATLPM
jgi:hypothetical protein